MLALLGLALVLVSPARAAPPPVSAFSRLPGVQQAAISPDGRRIAILGGQPDKRIIALSPLDGSKPTIIELGDTNIKSIRWATNDYLLATIGLFSPEKRSGESYHPAYTYYRDIVIRRDGETVSRLLAGADLDEFALSMPILRIIPGEKPVAIMAALERTVGMETARDSAIKVKGSDIAFAVWRVDLVTGKGRSIERGARTTHSWDVDATGEARVREDINPDTGSVSLFARAKGGRSWVLIDRSQTSRPTVVFRGYLDAEDAIILETADAAGVHLVKRSLTDGSTTPFGSTAPTSSADLIWDGFRHVPVAIVTEGERVAYQWLDADLGAAHARLSRAFPGLNLSFLSWSDDRKSIIVRVDGPSNPPVWYLYETATGQASLLGAEYPELANVTFGKTIWFKVKARDGLEIPTYLTIPPGATAANKAPIIVMPHGGPASRDSFEFDWWVQFLVSRGYAVLQPQFRGSAGFGSEFEFAGYGEWAGKMQTDLLDALAAAGSQGPVDPTRACIVGASYGGYAALAGATLHPAAYRCAVSVAGLSDLSRAIGDTRRAYGEDADSLRYWREVMGDPRTGVQRLIDASPARQVGPDTAPILLFHGEHDTVVPIEQSLTMKQALAAARRPDELVLLEGDDHYLSQSATRTRMLTALAAFLDRYLPVGP